MPISLGPNQLGECQRCGGKYLADQLSFDGRNPRLLVCPTCWDPAHPQERPFVVNDVEGVPRYPVAPEILPASHDPVLDAHLDFDGSLIPFVSLSWSTGDTSKYIIVAHEVYRALGPAGEFELLESFAYTAGSATRYAAAYTLAFSDTDVDLGTLYRYRVDAVTDRNVRLSSDIISVEVEPFAAPSAPVLAGIYSHPDESLSWTASTAGSFAVDFYQLERSINGGAYAVISTVQAEDPRAFVDTPLAFSTNYDWRVRAIDTRGNAGAYSNVVHQLSTSTLTDTFTIDGTWTKRPGLISADVTVIAAGGGGGSGEVQFANTSGTGQAGGGGGGGGRSEGTFLAAALGATEAVTVGVGGTGGAAAFVVPPDPNGASGNDGTDGGNSSFKTVSANGGVKGIGGTNGGTGTGGAGGTGTTANGGAGGTGGVFAGAPMNGGNSSGGGGGGGGQASGDTAGIGGNPPGTGGTSSSPGGDGGTGGLAGAVTGAAGANGNNYGAGGGGGGGAGGALPSSGITSGAGGNGAGGVVIVVSHF